MDVVDGARLEGEICSGDCYVFGGDSVVREIDEGIDRITDGEACCAGWQRVDGAGGLVARDGGQAGGTIGVLVGLVPGEFGAGDGGRADADERVAWGEDGPRGIFTDELFRATACVQTNCFHAGQTSLLGLLSMQMQGARLGCKARLGVGIL